MTTWPRLLGTGFLLLSTGSLALSGCDGAKEGMNQMSDGMGDAAQTAASGAAQTALAPVVSPLVNLLEKGRSEIEAGNLDEASGTMAGFQGLWETSAPLIKPLAGDKFPALEAAANTVITTFADGRPGAGQAAGAISGLLGPLSALKGG